MRPLLEVRPTPLDKPAVRAYADELTNQILERARDVTNEYGSETIDDHDELMRSEFRVADVKTKQVREFPVVVRSIVADGRVDAGSLLVGAGAGVLDGEFVVEIVINGGYTWQKLTELRAYLARDLYQALLHELTHAADHAYDPRAVAGMRPRYMDDAGEIDDEEYHNDPREVRAFLQETVAEALERAEAFARARRGENYTRDQLLAYVHHGKAWKRAEEFMDTRNRAKIMKAVYAALVDAGHV